MALFTVGDVVTIDFDVTLVATGLPTDPTAIVLNITSPSGATSQPTPIHDGTGSYSYELALTEAGDWYYSWTTTGTAAAFADGTINVRAPGSTIIQLSDVKDELRKSGTITTDDDKLQRMIDAALAEYAEFVGPLPGVRTEVKDGGGTTLVLDSPTAVVTAASYDSGAALIYSDLTAENGIVRWGYNTAGRFSPGRVSITYTVGSLPANHRETIIADVAGYFETTQHSSGAGQADFPGEGGFEDAYTGTPQVLFPRIRALGKSYPSVA